MESPTQQQNLAEFSLAVRESSLKRFRSIPPVNIDDEALSKRIFDDHYGSGSESSVWWICVRANLDHEIHHRGALAVYLRVLKEINGAQIGAV